MFHLNHNLAAWTPEQWGIFLPALGQFLAGLATAVAIPIIAAVLGKQSGTQKANGDRLDRHGAELDALKSAVPTAPQKPVNPALVDTLPIEGAPLPGAKP